MTRTHCYEAAKAIMLRKLDGSRLRDWALAIVSAPGRERPRSPLARKLAVILHALWRAGAPFSDAAPDDRRDRPRMRRARTHVEDEIAATRAGLDRARQSIRLT